jgi:hypothetical protein
MSSAAREGGAVFFRGLLCSSQATADAFSRVRRRNDNLVRGKAMKDVKVDVRVNVGVDMAGVVLLLASAAMAMFFYKQNKQEKLASTASNGLG